MVDRMKSILLDSETVDRFKDNINNKKYMVCWCYYEPGNDYGKFIDICKTRYGKKNDLSISARGISYFSLFSDQSIDNFSLKGLKTFIHSFVEIEEPKI